MKFKVGDKVIDIEDNEIVGIIRHIGQLNGEGRSTWIWSTWERKWNGILSSGASGGELTFIEEKELRLVKRANAWKGKLR